MDIRWQDDTGDTFALRNEEYLITYLNTYRPLTGLRDKNTVRSFLFYNNIHFFTSHIQPYIMRVSCHEALPNRNMLP